MILQAEVGGAGKVEPLCVADRYRAAGKAVDPMSHARRSAVSVPRVAAMIFELVCGVGSKSEDGVECTAGIVFCLI